MFDVGFRCEEFSVIRVVIKFLTDIKFMVDLRVDALILRIWLEYIDLVSNIIRFFFEEQVEFKRRMQVVKLLFFYLSCFGVNYFNKLLNNAFYFGYFLEQFCSFMITDLTFLL